MLGFQWPKHVLSNVDCKRRAGLPDELMNMQWTKVGFLDKLSKYRSGSIPGMENMDEHPNIDIFFGLFAVHWKVTRAQFEATGPLNSVEAFWRAKPKLHGLGWGLSSGYGSNMGYQTIQVIGHICWDTFHVGSAVLGTHTIKAMLILSKLIMN